LIFPPLGLSLSRAHDIMFSLYSNPNAYANPNPAMIDCYIQACRILASCCSRISAVSRVSVMVKVTVRDRCVKWLMWYGCIMPMSEELDLSAVDIAQLAHTADEFILCREG